MSDAPNLLILHTDQQSAWTLGAYGGTLVGTPHIDSLARDGARLDNFFVTSAVCTPSRGCMLTGRYPHCHGAYRNTMAINRDEQTLAHALAEAGYATGYVGKWHLDGESSPADELVPPDRAMGFADSRFMINRGHYKSVVEGNGRPSFLREVGRGAYMTDWLADRAIDFIDAHADRPFFCMLSIPDPHQPYTVREPYASLFDPAAMPIPASFHDRRHPRWVEQFPIAATNTWDKPGREADLRRNKAAYCGQVKCIDDNVGRVLAALAERGLERRTVVVFTTDHGDYMGEHGLYGKNMLYETAYRVPLLVRWPGRVAAGSAVGRFVTAVDLKQTVLGLMGLPPTGNEQGRDASPLLLGRSPAWRDEAFVHHSRHSLAGVFTPQWELGLARYGEHVLFDRSADPEQLHNRYDDPACRDVVAELTGCVVRHYRELNGPALEWLEALE